MLSRSILSIAFLLSAASASAQTSGSTPAAPTAQPLSGPVIEGVCLLSREAIFANSTAGKAASARIAELTRTAQAEINAQRSPLEAEAKALADQPDSAQTKQKREALAARWAELQRLAAHSNREMDATRVKAMDRIGAEAQPVIAQVYTQKKCGLLFDRNGALGGNFANDLTADVVRALDARLPSIAFDRERLPQQPATSASTAR